jgi:RNA polymerase sigma-70 factor, ECF subfamily
MDVPPELDRVQPCDRQAEASQTAPPPQVYARSSVTDVRSRTERFEQLALPLFSSLYNLAHWLAGSREEAEDLVQETYVKALRGFESFELGTNFRAWIFRILRNTFLTSRAGLAARSTVSLDDEQEEQTAATISTIETPESILLEHADHDAIVRAIESLPTGFREVLILCDVEEMSYREIADVLSIPIGTVMSRLARARGLMRKALGAKSRAAKEGKEA